MVCAIGLLSSGWAQRGCVFKPFLCCTLVGKASTTNNSANLTASCFNYGSDGEQSCGKGRKVSAYNWDHESWPRNRSFLSTIMNGDAVGTKVSVRYRQGGCKPGVAVKRGSTVNTLCATFWKRSALWNRKSLASGLTQHSLTIVMHRSNSQLFSNMLHLL